MTPKIKEIKRTATGIKFAIRIQGKLPGGKTIRERYTREFENKTAAQEWARERIGKLVRGEAAANERADAVPTLEDFYEKEFKPVHFARGGRGGKPLKPSRIADYRSIWKVHLLPRFGDTRIDAFEKQEIERFAAELATDTSEDPPRPRKQKTINEILTILGTILRKAHEWKKIEPPKIPIGQVEQEEIDYWTFEQFERLAAEAKRRGKYHYAVVMLGARAGLRAGEILSLRWDDIDFDRGQLCIRKATWREHENAPKSNKRRYVTMPSELAEALRDLPDVGARVIRAPRVKQATIETLRSYIHACEIGAELKGRGDEEKGQVHKLRHTYGAHLAMRGVPLLVIQAVMGHASYRTTLRYAHLAPRALHDAVLAAFGQQPAIVDPRSGKLLESHEKLVTPTGFEPVEKRRG